MNAIKEVLLRNDVDQKGNPTGGGATGTGIEIRWQYGPLGAGAERQKPNGAFIETVISVCIARLEFYQAGGAGQFRCRENALAIAALEKALAFLEARTTRRVGLGIEGTHAEEP